MKPFSFSPFPLLFAILLLAPGCANWNVNNSRKISSLSETELSVYKEGVTELEKEFSRFEPTHPKHKPVMLLHNGPTDFVVVLMHGLNESPWYFKGVAKFLHARGYNVVLPLLAKHWAATPSDMNKADFQEWIRDSVAVTEAAHKLGRKVIVAGHSTGGALAVNLAVNYPQLVDGLLLWSPAIALSYKTYYGAFVGWLANGVVDVDWNKLAGKPPFDPENVSYYSPLAGREVYRLGLWIGMEHVRRTGFMQRKHFSGKADAYASITVPTFIVEPEVDLVVHKPEVDLFAKTVSGPKVYLVQPGEQHNSVSKDEGDYFARVQRANRDFKGMTEKLGAFLDENFNSEK